MSRDLENYKYILFIFKNAKKFERVLHITGNKTALQQAKQFCTRLAYHWKQDCTTASQTILSASCISLETRLHYSKPNNFERVSKNTSKPKVMTLSLRGKLEKPTLITFRSLYFAAFTIDYEELAGKKSHFNIHIIHTHEHREITKIYENRSTIEIFSVEVVKLSVKYSYEYIPKIKRKLS